MSVDYMAAFVTTVVLGGILLFGVYAVYLESERVDESKGRYRCVTRIGVIEGDAWEFNGKHIFGDLGIEVREGLCERLDEER